MVKRTSQNILQFTERLGGGGVALEFPETFSNSHSPYFFLVQLLFCKTLAKKLHNLSLHDDAYYTIDRFHVTSQFLARPFWSTSAIA